jgi:hypothetical protein
MSRLLALGALAALLVPATAAARRGHSGADSAAVWRAATSTRTAHAAGAAGIRTPPAAIDFGDVSMAARHVSLTVTSPHAKIVPQLIEGDQYAVWAEIDEPVEINLNGLRLTDARFMVWWYARKPRADDPEEDEVYLAVKGTAQLPGGATAQIGDATEGDDSSPLEIKLDVPAGVDVDGNGPLVLDPRTLLRPAIPAINATEMTVGSRPGPRQGYRFIRIRRDAQVPGIENGRVRAEGRVWADTGQRTSSLDLVEVGSDDLNGTRQTVKVHELCLTHVASDGSQCSAPPMPVDTLGACRVPGVAVWRGSGTIVLPSQTDDFKVPFQAEADASRLLALTTRAHDPVPLVRNTLGKETLAASDVVLDRCVQSDNSIALFGSATLSFGKGMPAEGPSGPHTISGTAMFYRQPTEQWTCDKPGPNTEQRPCWGLVLGPPGYGGVPMRLLGYDLTNAHAWYFGSEADVPTHRDYGADNWTSGPPWALRSTDIEGRPNLGQGYGFSLIPESTSTLDLSFPVVFDFGGGTSVGTRFYGAYRNNRMDTTNLEPDEYQGKIYPAPPPDDANHWFNFEYRQGDLYAPATHPDYYGQPIAYMSDLGIGITAQFSNWGWRGFVLNFTSHTVDKTKNQAYMTYARRNG